MAVNLNELGISPNGHDQKFLDKIAGQTKGIEVAALPETHRIETRLFGHSSFDRENPFSVLLFSSSKKLPQEPVSNLRPPESLFDGDCAGEHNSGFGERIIVTAAQIRKKLEKKVSPEIPVRLKIGANVVENHSEIADSLIQRGVVPFPLETSPA